MEGDGCLGGVEREAVDDCGAAIGFFGDDVGVVVVDEEAFRVEGFVGVAKSPGGHFADFVGFGSFGVWEGLGLIEASDLDFFAFAVVVAGHGEVDIAVGIGGDILPVGVFGGQAEFADEVAILRDCEDDWGISLVVVGPEDAGVLSALGDAGRLSDCIVGNGSEAEELWVRFLA